MNACTLLVTFDSSPRRADKITVATSNETNDDVLAVPSVRHPQLEGAHCDSPLRAPSKGSFRRCGPLSIIEVFKVFQRRRLSRPGHIGRGNTSTGELTTAPSVQARYRTLGYWVTESPPIVLLALLQRLGYYSAKSSLRSTKMRSTRHANGARLSRTKTLGTL